MNYFAHAYTFLADSQAAGGDDPYLAVATGIPDMLTVVDRSVRLRQRQLEPYWDDPDPIVASTARGVAQHLADDARFHGTEIFARLSLDLTIALRDRLNETTSIRPRFLGHLLLEVLLDATLIARMPERLDRYYAAFQLIDAQKMEDAVNRMAARQTDRLAAMIETIPQVRFLSDYADDDRLWVRMNQVMHRAGLEPLPQGPFCSLLPEARRKVELAADTLLTGIPIQDVRKYSSSRAG
ncbi:MAG: hypothetical protein PVH19_06955 [Planctomycetia bacterium]|jgi:hypothetical protein